MPKTQSLSSIDSKKLFKTCFIALIATSFSFIVRIMLLDNVWQEMFNLSETQKGEIFGAGLWPFAISIVLFSLFIDKWGYRKAMFFAFFCHALQVLLLVMAKDYWWLWWGSFIGALGNGTVEAVINPAIATVYKKAKTKWLTILHAGWPGGLVLGGLLALLVITTGLSWQWQVIVLLFPAIIYGLRLKDTKFPVHERVEAGISHTAMLKEMGWMGALIVTWLVVFEIGTKFFPIEYMGLSTTQLIWLVTALIVAWYGKVVSWAPGKPLFVFLLLLMIPLATTELGTDAWIKDLMGPAMGKIGLDSIWVLIYTATLMMLLRLKAIGDLSKRFSPLQILAFSSIFAACGIYSLSVSSVSPWFILGAATIYGIGQTFFWPCTLGLVAEQFPKGGALTINAIAAVGMLGVGIIGTPLLGNLQDTQIYKTLKTNQPEYYQEFILAENKNSIFGEYQQLDQESMKELDDSLSNADDNSESFTRLQEKKKALTQSTTQAKSSALRLASIPPVFMAFCYFVLINYFRKKGGYKQVKI